MLYPAKYLLDSSRTGVADIASESDCTASELLSHTYMSEQYPQYLLTWTAVDKR